MKKNTAKKNRKKSLSETAPFSGRLPEPDSAVLFAILFLVAGFLGLLGLAVGEAENAAIARISDSIRTDAPYVRKNAMERGLERLVEGHPIADMIPYISHENPETAKFLVSIAKKESNWGKYSPKNESGETCYNYWGFRGRTEEVTRSGYSCFESPQEAVAVVGERLNYLIWDLRLDTPEELIVWKCGSTCAGHSEYGVEKWIRDVDYYARKIDSARLAEAGG